MPYEIFGGTKLGHPSFYTISPNHIPVLQVVDALKSNEVGKRVEIAISRMGFDRESIGSKKSPFHR